MEIYGALPTSIQNGWDAAVDIAESLIERIRSIAASIFEAIVPEAAKPWFERNVKALDPCDLMLLVAGLGVSLGVTRLALGQYGWIAFPLSLGAGAVIMAICFFSIHKGLEQHYNDLAWEQIDLMRRTANDLSNQNQDVAILVKERAVLDKPEYAHLEEKLKKLDEETLKFRTDLTEPNYQDKFEILEAHIDDLMPIIQANAHDQAIVDNLLAELDKVGTDDQDLAAIEKAKQKLKDLQTPIAKTQHALELSQQVKDLVKTLLGADFSKTKEAYLEYLKGFQQSLSKKEVEDL